MISFIGRRPAIRIGPYQVLDYDTRWLDTALRRAAAAADHEDFPLVREIRSGVEIYLETGCSLRLLDLGDLFAKVKKMLVMIGCERIAEKLKTLAPPVTISLVHAAMVAGNGYELAFFQKLRVELGELREAGAEEIHFKGLRESVKILRGTEKWDVGCERLLGEIEAFLTSCDREPQFAGVFKLSVEV